jgi:tetratricopeptide (TPR) repeat protein
MPFLPFENRSASTKDFRYGIFLILLCLVVAACAPSRERAITVENRGELTPGGATFPLWEPCTRQQAMEWAAADTGSILALKAASCYAVLAQEKGNKTSLADVREGLKLAVAATEKAPSNGLAHYLYAVLAGLQAEREPLKGLAMVPIIEREAKAAALLSPGIDRGGPDRVLGDLYLQAPGIPVSIGDPARASRHYQKAVEIAPLVENRLGLVAALLKEEETSAACRELGKILKDMPPVSEQLEDWRKSLELFGRLCQNLAGS